MAAQLSQLLGCNLYISEGRNAQLIRRLESLCRQRSRVALANTFIDEPYNRTGLTLVATSLQELTATVTAVAQQALSAIDLRQHTADHPRLGVVDHVSLHPLGPEATLQQAAAAAHDIGQQLAAPPICLPVYYYGSAHAGGRGLAEIRRRLGYFAPHQDQHSKTAASSSSSSGSPTHWAGSINLNHLSSYPPDAGPISASPAAGVVCIGAAHWVVNYNVPLYTEDLKKARAVAKAVSTRGGGLAGVQAMALGHGPGVIEVATNLIDYGWIEHNHHTSQPSQPQGNSPNSHISTSDMEGAEASQLESQRSTTALRIPVLEGASPDDVQAAVEAAAMQQGLPAPGQGYVTNKMPWELLELAKQQLLQQS